MKKSTRPKYEHHQSQLYALRCRRGLATLLKLPSEKVLRELIRVKPLTYRVFKNEAGREIQVPTGALLKVHERAAVLLRRLNVPEYVHSQRGRSYVTNARIHATNEPTIKTDIRGYFPNTRDDAVSRFFRDVMQCSPDVAWLLTNLLCYDGHVATGSPVSNELAFFANCHLMDAIHALAFSRQCRMTLLVDDITITGPSASKQLLHEVTMMLRSAGHRVNRKPRKTRTYGAGQAKHITGTVVQDAQVKLPNRRHKDLLNAFLSVNTETGTKRERIAAARKLRGHLAEAKNVDAAGISPKFTQRPRHRRSLAVPIPLKKAA